MELEIKSESLSFMEAVFAGVVDTEASAEKIVPDAMADVYEIISASVLPLLRSKEARDGRITVTGTADITVLCRFENGSVSALNTEAPLTFTCDVPGADADSGLIASISGASASPRLINPRKLEVTVSASCAVTCLSDRSVSITTGCGDSVEVNENRADITVTERAFEKTFSMSEEVNLPAGKPEIGEMLLTRARLDCEEKKAVGSKLIVRGIITAETVYIPAGGGEAERAAITLPFSQVIDVEAGAEEKDFEVTPALTGVFLTRGNGERTLLLDVNAVLQCRQLAAKTVTYISDAYCTSCDLNSDYGTVSLISARETAEAAGPLRGTIPAEGVEKIVSVSAEPPAAAVFTDGVVTANINVKVLYIGGGELKCASGVLAAEAPRDYPDASEPVTVHVPAEIYAAPAPGGIDARCQVTFRIITEKKRDISFITAAHICEGQEENAPSLLLKRADKGDTMWSLAKEGKSTPRLIITANGLADDAVIEPGRLLIIPRRK
ncbi:MAG: DUF3794 domain-containing protein [Oscillospiraceae bacterium]|nr:DUF3794 domain-containing protein [Oscillospiraceae bacterium]